MSNLKVELIYLSIIVLVGVSGSLLFWQYSDIVASQPTYQMPDFAKRPPRVLGEETELGQAVDAVLSDGLAPSAINGLFRQYCLRDPSYAELDAWVNKSAEVLAMTLEKKQIHTEWYNRRYLSGCLGRITEEY